MTREQILAVIQSQVRKIVPDAENIELNEKMRMSDFGADSLDAVEVVSRSMQELRIKIPRGDLDLVDDLEELVDMFQEALRKKAEASEAP